MLFKEIYSIWTEMILFFIYRITWRLSWFIWWPKVVFSLEFETVTFVQWNVFNIVFNRCVFVCFRKQTDVMAALHEGGMKGIKVVVQIFLNLLMYLAAFKFVNETLIWFGDRAGLEDFSLEVYMIVITFMNILPKYSS